MQISKFPLWICALALCGGLTLHAQDNPAQAAARAALQKKMDELNGNPPPAPAVVAPAPVAVAPAAAAPAVVAPTAVAPAAAGAAAIEVTPAGAAPVVETPTPAAPAVKSEPVKPVTAPTVAPAQSKEEKLRWLLARYKSDQITPEDYHTQRAAILAEP